MLRSIILSTVTLGVLAGTAHGQTEVTGHLTSLRVGGVERQWRMYVPPSYRAGTAMPLVIDLHGSGQTPDAEAGLSQFEGLAAEEGFLVATPAGRYLRPDNGSVSWNVYLQEDGVDDVLFVREMIGQVSRQFSVDPARVFAAGMSGGARMSSRLGCDLSDVIAAIGPVAGIQHPAGCSPLRSVPVITFHGRLDSVNHYEHQSDSPPYWDKGVEAAIAGWVGHNKCADSPTEERMTPEVVRVSYHECADGASVVLYRSDDAGHTWPGSPAADLLLRSGLGKTDRNIPATRLIWEFFKGHPLPPHAPAR